MNPDTRAALLALAEALARDPAALRLMTATYPIAEHLTDLIHDLEDHPDVLAA